MKPQSPKRFVSKELRTGIVLTLLLLFVCGSAISQGVRDTLKINNHEEAKEEAVKPETERILSPLVMQDKVQPRNTAQADLFQQASGFYGPSGFGAQYTLRKADRHLYGNLFISSLTNGTQRMQDAEYMVMTGFGMGYETLLHSPGPNQRGEVLRADVDGTQYYLRLGPGIGMVGVGRINGEFEVHPGIQAQTAIGVFRKMTRRGAFYAEFSGRLGWFPTLNEMHVIGGPHITFGFLIPSGQTEIPTLDY